MNKTDFKQLLSERLIILDGAMGTEMHKRGYLTANTCPEELNLSAPEKIQAIHRSYLEAGTNLIFTNTFGANRHKLNDYGLADKCDAINTAGVTLAKEAARPFNALVAGDVAPLGAYLSPLGPLSFDEAYTLFAGQIRSLARAGADIIVIETMAEIREVKAALLAAKDNFDGPVMVQMTFTAEGATVTGTDLLSFLAVVESMGADTIGMNCSVGPKDLARLAATLAAHTSLPISFKPNAGMPRLVNRETVFPGTPDEFAAASLDAWQAGVNLFGGCCGTSPEFIRTLAQQLKDKKPVARNASTHTLLSSRTKAFDLSVIPCCAAHARKLNVLAIGERINPTNRKKFQEELTANNFATLRREAREQVTHGADLLDINVGLPGADEVKLMSKAVEEIQETVNVPLSIDSSSADALEAGLKACAGKPLINSVNGEEERLERILGLAQRYGAAVIGLTTDQNDLPKTADARLAIAERIISAAERHGIQKKELVIDYLTMAASALPEQAMETLEAIRQSKKRWPEVRTVLGVSNISFGLPNRQILNSTFLKMAVAAGLDMAILNPHLDWSIDDPFARALLEGKDLRAEKYIASHGVVTKKAEAAVTQGLPPEQRLYAAVVDGNREEIAGIVRETLAAGKAPLDIANNILLQALNDVGVKFNTREYFLPQVIRSAEAAQAAFAEIKPLLKKDTSFAAGKIVMATVKGDVHDIGKNIVCAVLESHGWDVIDLGKNIDAETIVEAARREQVRVVGLSALMTTTMLEMEKVIHLRNAAKLPFKVMIGGAPVTQKFAQEIGADGYARDAVEAAQVVKRLTV
jgi:5-methyltetrahydrofolate--homocysteine methyltransferase